MNLVVMVPAFNEEATIARLLKEIPRNIGGVSSVKTLLVDDGSTDGTVAAAKKAGVELILSHKHNKGLAIAFKNGLREALLSGADIIVNIDADLQYNPKEIPKIIKPILDGEADVVLTNRNVKALSHMPFSKKLGNRLATRVTRLASGFPVQDAQSGFRAFSREGAMHLNVLSNYTYVQETIIQSVFKKLRIAQLPCQFNAREDSSRLIQSIWSYATKAGITILRTLVYYKPLKVFLAIGGLILLAGAAIGLNVLTYFLLTGTVGPFLPSAILTAMLVIVGFQVILLGLIADAVNANRRVQEEMLYEQRKRGMV